MHTQVQTHRTNTEACMHSHVRMSLRIHTRVRIAGMGARALGAHALRRPVEPFGAQAPIDQSIHQQVRTRAAWPAVSLLQSSVIPLT